MNVVSLFDGISCGQIALQKAGVEVSNYIASEIDKFPISITQSRYPNTKQIGDVSKIKSGYLPKIDLLIGGSPCQSLSRSGDGSGFNGKSKLFWEYVRILKQENPKYFFLENVTMKKEWEEIITKTLKVKPIIINSKLVSAQKRNRLYWTNIPNIKQPIDKKIKLLDIVSGNHKIINNHPLIIKKDGNDFYIKNGTKKGYLIANEGDGVNLEFPTSKTRRGRVAKQKTNTLNTGCNYGMILEGNLVELNINDYELLQTLPMNYTCGISESQRKKAIGNGWTIDVIVEFFKQLR